MQRRGFLTGAAAAGLVLAKPAIVRAWDAFPARRPGQFWRPGIKPNPLQTEFNPAGTLSRGMVSILLFEQAVTGNGAGAMPFRDYVVSSRLIGVNGIPVAVPSRFGGMAVNTSGTSFVDEFNYTDVTMPSLLPYTISALCRFDGIGGATYTGEGVLVSDAPVSAFVAFTANSNLFSCDGGEFTGGTLVTALTGYHRITYVGTASSSTFYLDGIVNGTPQSAALAFVPSLLVYGWPWPVADLFIWGRGLSANEVLAHKQDPYGTTLRPRFSELGLTSGTAAAVGKKPSLLTTGVGP